MPRTSTFHLSRRKFLLGLGVAFVLGPKAASAKNTIKYARGLRIPPNLSARIAARNIDSAAINNSLIANKNFLTPYAVSNPHAFAANVNPPPQFDWRSSGKVSPVKYQGNCGSCWAFAAIAACESANLVAGNDLNVLSDQQALDCSFPDNDCVAGGCHEVVLLYLELYGAVGDRQYPYKAAKGSCTTNITRSFFLANWGYVLTKQPGGGLIPTTDELKDAIYRYGPVVSAVLSTGWDDYASGVFAGVPSTNLEQQNTDHEVVIVGWDDSLASVNGQKGAWIIKNSWGEGWGEHGYIKLPYNCNKIGFAASWALAIPKTASSDALKTELLTLNKNGAFSSYYKEMFLNVE